jgi:hypothetical protein
MLSSKEKSLIEVCCKKTLIEFISYSPYLRENLTFTDHTKMLVWTNNLTYEESISAVFNGGSLLNEFGIRAFENKFKKFIKYGLAGLATIIMPGGPVLGMMALYLFRKIGDPCVRKCTLKFGTKDTVCKKQCLVDACQNMLNHIKSQLKKCDSTKNPPKCHRKLNGIYKEWSNKLAKYNLQLAKAKATRLKKTGKI